MSDTETLEITTQTASQDYECDAHCDVPIPSETKYVRVAILRDDRSAKYHNGIEKYHPSCWNEEGLL